VSGRLYRHFRLNVKFVVDGLLSLLLNKLAVFIVDFYSHVVVHLPGDPHSAGEDDNLIIREIQFLCIRGINISRVILCPLAPQIMVSHGE
jgi:hypothetical protein